MSEDMAQVCEAKHILTTTGESYSSFPRGQTDGILEILREHCTALVFDVTTKKGQKDIASLGYSLRRTKTFIDKKGKEEVAVWKEKAKVVDNERKAWRDGIDSIIEDVTRPLTELREAEEAARKAEEEFSAAWEEAHLMDREFNIATKEKLLREAEERLASMPGEETETDQAHATELDGHEKGGAEAPVGDGLPVNGIHPSPFVARGEEAIAALIALGVTESMAKWFVETVAVGAVPHMTFGGDV